jgi:hypothetical protein
MRQQGCRSALPYIDYPEQHYSKNCGRLKREVQISICPVAPQGISKQKKRNKNAKGRKSRGD